MANKTRTKISTLETSFALIHCVFKDQSLSLNEEFKTFYTYMVVWRRQQHRQQQQIPGWIVLVTWCRTRPWRWWVVQHTVATTAPSATWRGWKFRRFVSTKPGPGGPHRWLVRDVGTCRLVARGYTQVNVVSFVVKQTLLLAIVKIIKPEMLWFHVKCLQTHDFHFTIIRV